VDSVVHPAYRSRGVGGKLIEARYDVVRALNLRGMVAGSLIIDYHKVADHVPVEKYVEDVVAGLRFDTNLSKQIHKGFQVHGLIPNYSIDELSRGWGVEIVWENPEYSSQRRPERRTVVPRRYAVPSKPAHKAFVFKPAGA
jgi:GNAT superfamily N-acetyltransferase